VERLAAEPTMGLNVATTREAFLQDEPFDAT